MRREIKFRAWDGSKMRTDGYAIAPWDGHVSVNANVESWPLMQFTGLHDKNGKEIYEGDEVQWNTGKYRRTVEMKDGCWKAGPAVLAHLKKVEIIGNIYENPELLK